MPYPNEHACRLEEPGQFDHFARQQRKAKDSGKIYSAIIGFLKGGGSKDQAYRYPKDSWTPAEASAHCKDHGGRFEAAAQTQQMSPDEVIDPASNPFIETHEGIEDEK
jgi:hypothetical protein